MEWKKNTNKNLEIEFSQTVAIIWRTIIENGDMRKNKNINTVGHGLTKKINIKRKRMTSLQRHIMEIKKGFC